MVADHSVIIENWQSTVFDNPSTSRHIPRIPPMFVLMRSLSEWSMMILTTGLAVFFTFLEMISRLLWLNNKTILMLEEIIWKSKADLDHRACCRLTQSCSRRWSQRDWMRLFSTHCKSKAAMMSHQMNRPNANLWEWRLLFSEPADVSAGKVIWIVKIVANSHLKVIWSSGARDIQSYDTKKDIF